MKSIARAALLLPLAVLAAEPDAAARREIDHLIGHLAASGCQFNRNGTWYDAERAVSHIRRKYEYLLDRGLVPTADAFIERAASASSTSGDPYLVKCPGRTKERSAEWFRAELRTYRQSPGKRP